MNLVGQTIEPNLHNEEKDITKLSKRMFWDTPLENIHWYDHRRFILERVMRYGKIEDWNIMTEWYGKEELSKMAVHLGDMDDVSISFLSLVLGVPREKFRCYIERQLHPSFWHC